jgi:hypothetical protein
MPDPAKVTAYSTATGEKHEVPEHWLGHPVLGKGLRKTPTQKASENPTPKTPAAGDKSKEKS